MSKLVLFTLTNGAELIGEDVSGGTWQAGEGQIAIEHPLVIRPVKNGPGPQDFGLDLFPHSLTNPEGVHIFNEANFLSVSVNVPAGLEKAYLERTSSIILSTQLDKLEGLVK
jgi:hypothetical protein